MLNLVTEPNPHAIPCCRYAPKPEEVQPIRESDVPFEDLLNTEESRSLKNWPVRFEHKLPGETVEVGLDGGRPRIYFSRVGSPSLVAVVCKGTTFEHEHAALYTLRAGEAIAQITGKIDIISLPAAT